MTLTTEITSKVTASHLDRDAYVYVRQSTLTQVREHTESLALRGAKSDCHSHKRDFFSKADFTIDLEDGAVTCPAGVTVAISRTSKAKRTDVRFGEHCTSCHLRTKCTTRRAGRIVEINPAEELLLSARKARWTPEFRDRYRERARIERKNAQLKFRTQKIPWRGLVKADAWVKLRVAVLNMDRIGRMPGLIG
jgi:hypothetical protein